MQGFKVIGDDGIVVVSSDVPSQHYVGKAVYGGTISAPLTCFPQYANFGGGCGPISCVSGVNIYGFPFTACSGGGGLEGRTVYNFTIKMPNNDVPLVFIKPAWENAQYGIVNMYQDRGVWFINVLQRYGVIGVPELYIFSQCEGMYSNERFGLVLKDTNGKTTYDSRFNLLNVKAAVSVIPPEYAAIGGVPTSTHGSGNAAWSDNALDFNFNTTDNVFPVLHNVNPNNIMFCASSTAQAVWERVKGGSYSSDGGYGSDSQYHESRYAWWVMYYQTYGVSVNSVIAGWGIYTAGYQHYKYMEGDSNVTGIGNTGDSTTVGGTSPYTQKHINRRYNTVLISDSSLYD